MTQIEPAGLHDARYAIDVHDRKRTFRLHVPPAASRRDRLPVLLAFHGTGADGDRMAAYCGLNHCADRYGFAVVYPDGTGRVPQALSWNTGHPSSFAARHGVDDIGFTLQLLDWLKRQLSIDSQRVYAVGMSSGATLCYRLAQQLSAQIAAIGPVAGTMVKPFRWPAHRVPVAHLHGTADEFVPYEGGRGARSLSRIEFTSVRETLSWWVKVNRCEPTPVTEPLPARIEDGTRVERAAYRDETGQERVVLFTITGGGHTWPGQPSPLNFLGRTTANLAANEELWNFFESFRRD